MKKKLLFGLLMASSFAASAQHYIWTKTTDTYTPLTGATELYGGAVWDDPSVFDIIADPSLAMPLGFGFNCDGYVLDSIFIYEEGALMLSDSIGESFTYGNNGFTITGTPSLFLFPVNYDLNDREEVGTGAFSTISYKTEGTSGNRIFKFEMKEAGFYDEIALNGVADTYISYQVWLHEGSNVIEYRYGPSVIADPTVTSFNGIHVMGSMLLADTMINGLTVTKLTGAEDTTYTSGDKFSNHYFGYLDMPANGTVFRFSPQNASLSELKSMLDAQVYPNPFVIGQMMHIRSEEKMDHYEIWSLDGALMTKGSVKNNSFNLTGLSQGAYLVHLKSGDKTSVSRIIIQ